MSGVYKETLPIAARQRLWRVMVNRAAPPDWYVREHWHDPFEMLHIRQGRCVQWINGHCAELEAGDVALIQPGDVHASRAVGTQPGQIDVLQFAPELLAPQLLPDGPPFQTRRLLRSGWLQALPNDAFAQCFDRLHAETAQELPGQAYLVQGLIYTLIGHWQRSRPEAGLPMPEQGTRQDVVRGVCQYIREQVHTPLRLKDVAQHFGYSPEHLCRLFRAVTGEGFKAYVDTVRMEQAVHLMWYRRLSVQQTAAALGYADPSILIRAFKRAYHITPYRYLQMKGEDLP